MVITTVGDPGSLLLHVALNLRDRPGRAATWILAELAAGATLSQQIPVLVELLFRAAELLLLLICRQFAGRKPGAQIVLGLDEVIYVAQDVLVVHGVILPRGFAHPCIPAAAVREGVRRTVYVSDMQLTRRRIIAAAMALIERDGVEAISMRRLASELGCGVMSLYNHVPSKSALLDGVADAVMSGIEITPVPGAGWQEQVRAQARAFRQIARAHPRCAMVVVSRPPSSAAMVRPVESALATLRRAGFSGHDAVRIVRAFVAYIMGSLLREVGVAPALADGDGDPHRPYLRPTEFPQVTDLAAELSSADEDADFEFGLDLLLHAIAALHPAAVTP